MVLTDGHLEMPATRELLARARAGETQAFCLLIEPLQARLLQQAAALAGNLTAAEDLVAETLVEAWKSLARYNETCRLSTWLYAILLHRHQNAIRHARRRPVAAASLSADQFQTLSERQQTVLSAEMLPDEAASQRETLAQISRCLEALPEKHRQAILLRFFEDATLPDMAAVLGCSVGTVKSRLHHALEKLRQMKMNLPDVKGDQ